MSLSRHGHIRRIARLVRVELAERNNPHAKLVTDEALHLLMVKVGQDAALAADCLVQWPRPQWLEDLVGAYPMELELLNPADTASTEEWGHAA